MTKPQRNLLLAMLALVTLQAVVALTRTEFYPFSKFPMYAGLRDSANHFNNKICLSREKMTLDSLDTSKCLPHPKGLNFFMWRLMDEWKYNTRWQDDPHFRKELTAKHTKYLRKSLYRSRLEGPLFLLAYTNNWVQVGPDNWSSPDFRSFLFDYEHNDD